MKTSLLLLFVLVGVGLLVIMIGIRLFVGYSSHVDLAYADMSRMQLVLNEISFANEEEMVSFIEDLFPHWKVERPIGTEPYTKDHLRRQVKRYGGSPFYVRMNTDYIWSSLLKENKLAFFAGLLALVLFLQITLVFAKRVTTSLQKIENEMSEISSGAGSRPKHKARLPVEGYSVLELEKLTNRFNEAVAQMEDWRDFEKKIERMERFAMMGEMASGVAHEIRNPMAAMKMQLNLLRTFAGKDPTYSELLDNIDEELGNLENKVDSFIEFARYEPGAMLDIDPDNLISWVIRDIAHMAEARGITVRVVPGEWSFGKKISFKGDPALIKQALMNMSVNAIQAMENGGTITMSVTAPVGEVIFTVEDTGKGVPEGIAPRIFEPFVSGRPDGTGLGLATARKIAEDHNGSIKFTTSTNGSAFRISLPRAIEL